MRLPEIVKRIKAEHRAEGNRAIVSKALGKAEVLGGNRAYANRACEHKQQSKERKEGKRSIFPAGAKGADANEQQGDDGKDDHAEGYDKMHLVLNGLPKATIGQRKKGKADAGDPVHHRKEKRANAKGLVGMVFCHKADHHAAKAAKQAICRGQTVGNDKGRGGDGGQIADGLAQPVIARVIKTADKIVKNIKNEGDKARQA